MKKPMALTFAGKVRFPVSLLSQFMFFPEKRNIHQILVFYTANGITIFGIHLIFIQISKYIAKVTQLK
jgi:hypothetical protein